MRNRRFAWITCSSQREAALSPDEHWSGGFLGRFDYAKLVAERTRDTALVVTVTRSVYTRGRLSIAMPHPPNAAAAAAAVVIVNKSCRLERR